MTKMRTILIAAAVTLAGALAPAAFAQAADEDAYGDGYQSGAYGRIRYSDGGASIIRADGERDQHDRVGVNAPIFPGDALRTEGGERVEIQLAGGSIVRVDEATEVLFQSLPDAGARYEDNVVLALRQGAIRIVSQVPEKDEFRVDTRDASVYLLGDGEFRVEVDDRGGTHVASLRGVAEVVGDESSVLVRGGSQTVVLNGSAPDTPRAYSALRGDEFDRWCGSREDSYRAHDRYDEGDYEGDLPSEVRPYYGELSAQGRWVVVPDYGQVWYPVGVAPGWRPYSDGYWAYGPGGYFWVSYEPWGWAPYHYGNWQWIGGHGWCWIPGHVFAGAWVSWSWGSLYVGWAPLDYWGRPGWVGGPYYYGYYDPGCWTFVNYTNIHVTNVRRYAVPITSVRNDLRQATVVARAPRIDPGRIAQSRDWRDRAIREVANDRGARLSPIDASRRPERKLRDVQERLYERSWQARRNERAAAPQDRERARPLPGTPKARLPEARSPQGSLVSPRVGGQRGVGDGRPRRILQDPRQPSRPSSQGGGADARRSETRDDVRELYQRMSRPRETRGQEAIPQRRESAIVSPRRDAPRDAAPRVRQAEGRREPQQQQRSQADAPRGRQPEWRREPQQQRSQTDAPRGRQPEWRREPPQQQRSQADAPRGRQPEWREPRVDRGPTQQGPRVERRIEPQRAPARIEPQRGGGPAPRMEQPRGGSQRQAPAPRRESASPRGNGSGQAKPRGHDKH